MPRPDSSQGDSSDTSRSSSAERNRQRRPEVGKPSDSRDQDKNELRFSFLRYFGEKGPAPFLQNSGSVGKQIHKHTI